MRFLVFYLLIFERHTINLTNLSVCAKIQHYLVLVHCHQVHVLARLDQPKLWKIYFDTNSEMHITSDPQ